MSQSGIIQLRAFVMSVCFSSVILVGLGSTSLVMAQDNLLRNGSFEGSRQYWMEKMTLDKENPGHGQYSVKLEGKGGVRSSSFPLQEGKRVTISFMARTGKPGNVGLSISPSNRQTGQKTKWLWNGKRSWKGTTTTEWKRYSFDIQIPTVDGKGGFVGSDVRWWDKKSWILMIGGTKPLWVDAVTVSQAGKGKSDFVPYHPVETSVEVPELPGYTEGGNILKAGLTLNPVIHLYNAQAADTTVSVEIQQLSYDAKRLFAKTSPQTLTIPAGKTLSHGVTNVVLKGKGLTLIRAVVKDAKGTVVGQSDQPVTALAFPKSATSPNPKERFGASLRGKMLTRAAQQIGLGWTRWYPQLNWAGIQPKGPEEWKFPDEVVNDLLSHGISCNAVLYSLPKWAKQEGKKHSILPKDMADWGAKDPRWDDLGIVTTWDTFVTKTVKHYAHTNMAFEFFNEPEIHTGLNNDDYANLQRRTHKLIKAANPKAKSMVNATWPGMHGRQMEWLKRGGAKYCDVYTFHNYVRGPLAYAANIDTMKTTFKSFGNDKMEIWFNEGWHYSPTSVDYASLPIIEMGPEAVADMLVRTSADLFTGGMEKLIAFHIGYSKHGKSLWDWVGSGTEWWDDHGNPTVSVGTYNVLADQIGLSTSIGKIVIDDVVLHVFQDNRHNRGVVVAWSKKTDDTIDLGRGLTVLDVMGNTMVTPSRVNLGRKAQPWFISKAGMSGADWFAKLKPRDTQAPTTIVDGRYIIPKSWTGTTVGKSDGSTYLYKEKPLWQIGRLWPVDHTKEANFLPLVWSGKSWGAKKRSHGGQPGVNTARGKVGLGSRAAWGGQPGNKIPYLRFFTPAAGTYRLSANITSFMWEGGVNAELTVYKRDGAGKLSALFHWKPSKFKKDKVEMKLTDVTLAEGDQIQFIPSFTRNQRVCNFDLNALVIELQK